MTAYIVYFVCIAAAYIPGDIKRVLKHPMLVGIKLWAFGQRHERNTKLTRQVCGHLRCWDASDIAQSPTPDTRRQKLIDDYKARFANPYTAAERGYIDDVIVPHETRPKLITALETLLTKREPGPKRKHGNIPL